MKRYFGYIRVSTTRQGQQGSSLTEQRSAIQAYAKRNGLSVVAWFEEQETAAKQGRRIFSKLLAALVHGEADGVVIHKIDRSARNLRDWAQLGDLIDRGIDVQFAHDNMDLRSRGGRLAADIQAVVAADYIRNLRDEVRKGFYGRLKQGYYPLPAPTGYLDRGQARAKEIDPVFGPLVRQAFELYATGRFSLMELRDELRRRGLKSHRNGKLSVEGLSGILKNPFYIGLIRIVRTGETFQGAHAQLIPKALFDRVQDVFAGRTVSRAATHDFLFRRMIRCETCGHWLVGEIQKQRYVYYRCHSDARCGTSISENSIEGLLRQQLDRIYVSPVELRDLRDLVERYIAADAEQDKRHLESIRLRVAKCEQRLLGLTDALIDGVLNKDMFEERKQRLLGEKRGLLDELERLNGASPLLKTLEEFELRNSLILGYEMAIPAEKREILENISSNFLGRGKNPAITLRFPYSEIINSDVVCYGGPYPGNVRTFAQEIFEIFKTHYERYAANDTEPDEFNKAA